MRIGLDSESPAVRSFSGRFGQQEAVFGNGQEQSAPAIFFDDVFVVFARFKAQQRQMKTFLAAARFGVAYSGVATGFGQHGNDIVHEADGRRRFLSVNGARKIGGRHDDDAQR